MENKILTKTIDGVEYGFKDHDIYDLTISDNNNTLLGVMTSGTVPTLTPVVSDTSLTISNGTIKHTNLITASNNAVTLGSNTVTFKQLGYDVQGHINSNVTGKVLTFKNGIKSDTSGNVEHSNAITAGNNAITLGTNTVTFKQLGYDGQGHINSNANGKVLTFKNGIKSDTSGNVEHSNAITARTASSAGKLTFDAQGHINGFTAENHIRYLTGGSNLTRLTASAACNANECIIYPSTTWANTDLPIGSSSSQTHTIIVARNSTNTSTYYATIFTQDHAGGVINTCTVENGVATAWRIYLTRNDIVTTVASSSTDTQVPSAKCLYTMCGDVAAAITALTSGTGV